MMHEGRLIKHHIVTHQQHIIVEHKSFTHHYEQNTLFVITRHSQASFFALFIIIMHRIIFHR